MKTIPASDPLGFTQNLRRNQRCGSEWTRGCDEQPRTGRFQGNCVRMMGMLRMIEHSENFLCCKFEQKLEIYFNSTKKKSTVHVLCDYVHEQREIEDCCCHIPPNGRHLLHELCGARTAQVCAQVCTAERTLAHKLVAKIPTVYLLANQTPNAAIATCSCSQSGG